MPSPNKRLWKRRAGLRVSEGMRHPRPTSAWADDVQSWEGALGRPWTTAKEEPVYLISPIPPGAAGRWPRGRLAPWTLRQLVEAVSEGSLGMQSCTG